MISKDIAAYIKYYTSETQNFAYKKQKKSLKRFNIFKLSNKK